MKILRIITRTQRFKIEQEEKEAEVEKQVDAAKKAKREAAKKLAENNKKLQRTILENHFTIRIYKATGGKTQ